MSCFYVAGLYGSITIETNAGSYTVRMPPHSLFLSRFYFSTCLPPSLFQSLATFLTPFKFSRPLAKCFARHLSIVRSSACSLPFCVLIAKNFHQVGAREAGSYHKVEIARRDLFDVVAFIGMERRISSPLLPWPPSKCTIPNMSFFPMLWEFEAL